MTAMVVERVSTAWKLPLARSLDCFLQAFVAHRRIDHPVADHEKRSSSRAKLAGEAHVGSEFGLLGGVVRRLGGNAGGSGRQRDGIRPRSTGGVERIMILDEFAGLRRGQ